MKNKQCCYMARDCTPVCVAYNSSEELSEGSRDVGMDDIHCMRLVMDLAAMLNSRAQPDDEDEEDFDDEEEI